jgi:hypothetical protein
MECTEMNKTTDMCRDQTRRMLVVGARQWSTQRCIRQKTCAAVGPENAGGQRGRDHRGKEHRGTPNNRHMLLSNQKTSSEKSGGEFRGAASEKSGGAHRSALTEVIPCSCTVRRRSKHS